MIKWTEAELAEMAAADAAIDEDDDELCDDEIRLSEKRDIESKAAIYGKSVDKIEHAKAVRREYYLSHREEKKAYARKYYVENREKIDEYKRKYYQSHKADYRRRTHEYEDRHPEEVKARQREYAKKKYAKKKAEKFRRYAEMKKERNAGCESQER